MLIVRRRLAVTKAGRSFLAVRDIVDRARCFGIEPGPNKLLAYAISGAIVGLGGAVLALKSGSISAKDPFLLLESLTLVAVVVVGGAGSAAGIITAAILFKGLPQFYSTIPFTDLRSDRIVPIASALLLVISIVAAPEGIGGAFRALGRVVDRVFGGKNGAARTAATNRRRGRRRAPGGRAPRRAPPAVAAHAGAGAARGHRRDV